MKIQLSEFETYNLTIPEKDFSIGEFLAFAERVNKIAKTFGKDEIVEQTLNKQPEKKKETKQGKNLIMRIITKDRKLAISLVRDYYLGSEIDKKYLAKKLGVSEVSGKIFYIKEQLKIKPSEVGLKEFPNFHNIWDFKRNKDKWIIK